MPSPQSQQMVVFHTNIPDVLSADLWAHFFVFNVFHCWCSSEVSLNTHTLRFP